MILFQLIEIDMLAERKRIASAGYNLRQSLALFELCDLFEAGKWQECLDHIKANFGYDEEGEYSEQEHIGMAISAVLKDLGYSNFFTSDQLLQEVKEKIAEEALDK